MPASRSIAAVVVSTTFLSGCAVLPPLPRDTAVRTDEIVRHIQCELKDAYRQLSTDYPWLTDWAAGYKLTYRADAQHSGGLASGLWTVPGGVTVGAGATVTTTGTRQGTIKYQTYFRTITALDCPAGPDPAVASAGFRSNLGIAEWLSQALIPSKAKDTGRPRELGYTITFVAKLDSSLKPTFSIVNLTGTGTAGWIATSTDSLDLGFTDATPAPPPKPPKPIPVFIVPNPAPVTTHGVGAAVPAERSVLPEDVQRRLDNILDGLADDRNNIQ